MIAEIRSSADPSLTPSRAQFRLVEFEDGPFLETSITEVAEGHNASMWIVQIDGRLRAKCSYPGGIHGIRISPEQYDAGITVLLLSTDDDDVIIQSTEEVAVPTP